MKKIIYLIAIFVFLISCQDEINKPIDMLQEGTRSVSSIPLNTVQKGKIVVKLTESAINKLQLSESGSVQMNSVPSPMSAALNNINATQIERLFPPAGKYEKRTRKQGLHRWMIITFDEKVEVSKAMTVFNQLEGVEIVEPMPIIKLMGSDNNPFDAMPFAFQRGDKPFFNDPMLSGQWHYNNIGASGVPAGVQGADINLYEAWKITTGTPNVVVCVVDGGIDVQHPDLKDNLWVNTKERDGEPGKDDDGNGYIDDINGYCFAANTGDLAPDDDGHGTHVSGTVAARNNNSVGVCGVAGGNGDPNSGVRLMSAAIFRGANRGDGARAIKYGADNGAVISQNSWGYSYSSGVFTLPAHLKDAIDYFIKNAGCDNDGNQLPNSPMKGGVVFFAAGNDNKEFTAQPASYEQVIAVTAMAPNFKKASYSNYGEWADIMAPGGDQNMYGTNAGVLSTWSPRAKNTFGKEYGRYQGTSMACPHTSGVAALIVSKFGGKGFTNDMLKEQILASLLPLNIDEQNPGYEGKLGAGYLDAYAAVHNRNEHKAPETPKFIASKTIADFTQINVFWNVPKDADDGQASFYKLFYSSEELTTSNYQTKGKAVGNINGIINGMGLKAGDEMSYIIKNLMPSTHYYFALVAYDRWQQASGVALYNAKTKHNDPPVVTNMPELPIKVLDISNYEYKFNIKDPEGHQWTYSIDGETKGVTHSREGDAIKLSIRPILEKGTYKMVLTLTDELGSVNKIEIPFTIITVLPPKLVKPIPPQLLGVGNGSEQINLTEHFQTEPLFKLSYSVKSVDGSIVSASVKDNGNLTIEPHKVGKTMVTVVADNGYKKTETSFEVLVTQDKNKNVYSVWPIPVVKDLNAWINPKFSAATFVITTVNGEEVMRKEASVNQQGIATVDLKNLVSGTYVLKVLTSGETFTKTIVKR